MEAENQIMLFDIQRGSFVDGPGIRTTLFFKGCNLNCRWCHNPESKSFERQLMIYKNKCTHCGICRSVCHYNTQKCDYCGECEASCPSNARRICGKQYSVEKLFDIIKQDKEFFDASGGGVTFSGGECMLQLDGLEALLKRCNAEHIHSAVDTAGNVDWKSFERIIDFADLFLYDIKCISPELHKKYTGAYNDKILQNLINLSKLCHEKILVRVPIIPSVNNTAEEFGKIADFIKSHNLKSELLAYHAMGKGKADALNESFYEFPVPDKAEMERLRKIIKR